MRTSTVPQHMLFAPHRLLPVSLVVALACHQANPDVAPSPDSEGSVLTVTVSASSDSTVKLAKFAMGIVDGIVQLPQARKEGIAVATRYARPRQGGGQTDVAIIAIVQRPAPDGSESTTIVRLSGWALDTRGELPIPQRRGSTAPAAASQRPAVAMRPNQPRRITPKDASDWESLQLVLAEFVRQGAKPIP